MRRQSQHYNIQSLSSTIRPINHIKELYVFNVNKETYTSIIWCNVCMGGPKINCLSLCSIWSVLNPNTNTNDLFSLNFLSHKTLLIHFTYSFNYLYVICSSLSFSFFWVFIFVMLFIKSQLYYLATNINPYKLKPLNLIIIIRLYGIRYFFWLAYVHIISHVIYNINVNGCLSLYLLSKHKNQVFNVVLS